MANSWNEIRCKRTPNVGEQCHGEAKALPIRQRDLSDIAGTWVDDPAFDVAVAEQDTIWPIREDADSDSAAEKTSS